jgi:hypothetical protein
MRPRAATWTLAGLTALVLAVALTLLGLDARYIGAGKLAFEAVMAVAVVLYAGTGHLLTVRRPGNVIGLLLALVGLLLALEMLTEQYPLYGLVTAPGSLPAARLAGWFCVLVAVLAVVLLLFLVLLFPDGRLPSRRWRPVRTGFLVVMAASVVSQMQAGQYISGGLTNILDDSKASYPNPVGIFPSTGGLPGLSPRPWSPLSRPPCAPWPRCSPGGAGPVQSCASSWPGSVTSVSSRFSGFCCWSRVRPYRRAATALWAPCCGL